MKPVNIGGVEVFSGYLGPVQQRAMLTDLRQLVEQAPMVHPVTPRGQKMSVRMTSAGKFGWISDRRGYRYAPRRPNGQPWPEIPDSITAVWSDISGCAVPPECCLVNYYAADARMGLHQDRDEADFDMPVVSISLGDDALFRIGGLARRDRTQSIWLKSGDVAVLAGPARLAFHGIDRLRPGSSSLLPNGGRINVTLRVVT